MKLGLGEGGGSAPLVRAGWGGRERLRRTSGPEWPRRQNQIGYSGCVVDRARKLQGDDVQKPVRPLVAVGHVQDGMDRGLDGKDGESQCKHEDRGFPPVSGDRAQTHDDEDGEEE